MTTLQKGQIVALGVLIGFPFLVWALKRWWSDISGPFQSRDDTERKIAKGSVLTIFLATLFYATLGAVASIVSGQIGLAVFSSSIGWWIGTGFWETQRDYHLLEVLEFGR